QRQVAKPSNGIVVGGIERQPKDLADSEAKKVSSNDGVATNDAIAGAGGGGATAAPTSPTTGFADAAKRQAPGHAAADTKAPDNKPAPAAPVATTPAPAPAPAQVRGAEDKKTEVRKETVEDAWARDQLGKAIQLAKAANCN